MALTRVRAQGFSEVVPGQISVWSWYPWQMPTFNRMIPVEEIVWMNAPEALLVHRIREVRSNDTSAVAILRR